MLIIDFDYFHSRWYKCISNPVLIHPLIQNIAYNAIVCPINTDSIGAYLGVLVILELPMTRLEERVRCMLRNLIS